MQLEACSLMPAACVFLVIVRTNTTSISVFRAQDGNCACRNSAVLKREPV